MLSLKVRSTKGVLDPKFLGHRPYCKLTLKVSMPLVVMFPGAPIFPSIRNTQLVQDDCQFQIAFVAKFALLFLEFI